MVIIDVPYFLQHDNLPVEQSYKTGYRECFSSSCAMLAGFYGRIRTDDEYNLIRARFGDTTSVQAQILALQELKLEPRFKTKGNLVDLHKLIEKGCPVAVGWLHKGHVRRPEGGGHWSVVIGYEESRTIHNDPFGEADMINGGYINYDKGEAILYSNVNWMRRWAVEGTGSGWYLYCKQ